MPCFRNWAHRLWVLNPASTLAWTLAALVSLAQIGCGGRREDATETAAGTVIVDGSSTVYRISKAAQEAYTGVSPDVTVVVNQTGTGGGFGKYLEGEVDVVDASRDAKPEEAARAKAQGIEWTRFLVGYDGITIVVNPKNTFVKSITTHQLRAIWAADSKVKTWKDIDPSWPDRKIVLYCPDNASGTYEFFKEAILGKTGEQREDVQASADDNILVNGVAGDPDGLGYFGYAYFASNQNKLRALAVQNGENARPIMPTLETVLDKSYAPLSRPLYLFVKNSSLRRPDVSGFIKYYLLNVKACAERGGFAAPTADDQSENARLLAAVGPAVGAAPGSVPGVKAPASAPAPTPAAK